MMSIDEASGFKETNQNINTLIPVSSRDPTAKFEPSNKIGSIDTAVIIKPTIEE